MIDENRRNMSIFRIEQAKECLVMADAIDTLTLDGVKIIKVDNNTMFFQK